MPARWKPCSLVRARRRTCRLSRNKINVQGVGLELRHVKLSHRCFSSYVTILAAAIPAGNERKRRIAPPPYRGGQRKIGWTASRATERPFRPCLRAPGRGSVIRMYSQAKRHVAVRLLLHATEIASAHFPPHLASLPQSLSRETSSTMFPRRFVFPTPAAWLHLTLQSCIKQTFRTYTSVLTPLEAFRGRVRVCIIRAPECDWVPR